MREPRQVFRNRVVQSLAAVVMAMCLGTGLAIALDPKGPPYLGGIVGTVGPYLVWMVGWQSSVRLRPDGVEVNNLFMSGFVPWAEFKEFRVANGLKVVMTDGRVIGSFAFGGSLIGQLTGYRSMRRLVQRMEAGRRELVAGQSQAGPAQGTVRVPTANGYWLRVRIAFWPVLLFAVPLELIGLVTASTR